MQQSADRRGCLWVCDSPCVDAVLATKRVFHGEAPVVELQGGEASLVQTHHFSVGQRKCCAVGVVAWTEGWNPQFMDYETRPHFINGRSYLGTGKSPYTFWASVLLYLCVYNIIESSPSMTSLHTFHSDFSNVDHWTHCTLSCTLHYIGSLIIN